jgi:hypothetical protein
MTIAKSRKVPKGWEEYFAGMCRLTRQCCEQHLNAEYAELAEYLIAALCRKRPSRLSRGKPETWACAVLYALGQINFLSDKASTPCMTMADLCDYFGVSSSTGGTRPSWSAMRSGSAIMTPIGHCRAGSETARCTG